MSDQVKPLTSAQIKHLVRLNEIALRAQADLQAFIAYLREEHEAPSSAWELGDIQVGFKRVDTKAASLDG